MALNQDAHRRNQEAFERVKQLRAKQKKYNITPENAYKSANQLSEYANTAGKGLDKLGQITNNETLQNLGQKIANNTGSNLKNNMFNFAKDKITTLADKAAAAKNAASTASNAASTAGNVSNAASTASNAANVASNASNVANAASTASNAASAASNASNAANAASSASSAASSGASAAPVVGTALGAVSAGNNFAKGDNVNGALDVVKTGAAFIPVYGWIVSAAISAFQKARNMFIDKKMKAHAKTQDAAAKATEESMMSANETKQKIANKRAEMQQQMAAENPINGQLGDSNLNQMGMPSKQAITNEFKQEPVGNFAEKGNIDLFNRPVTQNADGTISTVRSMSFNDGNHEVLIPTVADDGSILSEEDAIDNYYKTGKHLGKFNSVEDANKYAETLHNQQDGLYSGSNGGKALPKETISQGIMDKVKGLFGKEEGQMTGGAANASSILDMFEDPTVFSDYNKLAREQEQKQGTAPFKNFKYGLQGKLRGDTTSDMNGSVAYDYRSPATKENENRRIADMINKEIEARRQPAQQVQQPAVQEQTAQQPIKIGQDVQFTPEQQARYNKAMAIQNAGSQSEALPPVPTVTPTASPSRANFNPNQFDIINPDGTITPASQQAQQPVIQGQVSTTQPAQLVDLAQTKQQAIPYDEKAGRVANIMQRIRQGYGENTTESFDPANMADKTFTGAVKDENGNVVNKEINKNIWNRLGEGVGTGQKLLSNPLMQGLIAGAVYKATGGDGGESLKYGVDWAQNKAKSDYYQKQINPNAKPSILGGYTAEDWKTKESIENAKAQQQYSQAILEERRRENNIRIQKMISDMQKGSNSTQDPSFNETLNGILSNKYIAPERKLEALSNLLRDYSTRGKSQLAYAKSFADLYGIDLDLGI